MPETNNTNQRLKASSHYCECQEASLYVPNCTHCEKTPGNYLGKVKTLIRTALGSYLWNKLKGARSGLGLWLPFSGSFHKRYSSNNNLCIDITTVCNLRCFNCQASVRQAPANDIMSVEQMEKFVNEAIELKYYWNRISLFGGEPALHPQFFEILGVLRRYKDFSPDSIIDVVTNGAGDKVKSVLVKLPGWVSVESSEKKEKEDSFPFGTYNIAPIDTLAYRFFSDFSKGCQVLALCYGLGLSRYGYYPCSPCMHVDRVFGFDIGIKKLSQVNEQALGEQMKILCRYCGWFKKSSAIIWTEMISRSWKKAYAEYKKQKPKLSLYG